MIKAKVAFHNMILHQKREPIKDLETLSEMIRVASVLGFENIQVFIRKRDEDKFRKKLKSSGFVLSYIYPKSLPNEVMLVIDWNTSEFIGDTRKELNL